MHEQNRLGLIGIGNIGSVFAEDLLAAGHPVAGFSRPHPAGFAGTLCASPAELAGQADIILCCLPHEKAATSVYDGPDGLLAGLAASPATDKIVLDLASYGLEFKRRLADQVAETGALMLDGEVSGTPDMLRARAGAIFLGGDAAACARVLPICDILVPRVFLLGGFGAAGRMKLINNLLSAVHTAAAAEAMALGVKAGFAPGLLAEVLSAGSGSSKFLVSRAPMMAAGKFAESPGPLVDFDKYLDYVPKLAEASGSATPLFDAARRCFKQALAEGRGAEDIAVVFDTIMAMER